MKNSRSHDLFSETEKVGEKYDLETHAVIFDRYEFAGSLCKNCRVLEVGCGSGIGLEYLSGLSDTLDAIEFSEENVGLINAEDVGSATIIKGDAHETPYKAAGFDLVIALAMIYYLSLPEFFRESSRILSDEGILFFCTSNKDVPGFCEAPYTTGYYSVPELHLELSKTGFDAEFYGAFPKDHGPLVLRIARGWVKNAVKKLFGLTEFGRAFWDEFRQKSLGNTTPLPVKLTKKHVIASERILLSPYQRNYNFRVIYVVARKNNVS